MGQGPKDAPLSVEFIGVTVGVIPGGCHGGKVGVVAYRSYASADLRKQASQMQGSVVSMTLWRRWGGKRA